MEIVATQAHEFPAVEVRGRVDSGTAGSLQERLSALARGEAGGLIVDLSQVAHMSSAGFRALLVVAKAGGDSGCPVALCGLSTELQRLLTLSGFDEFFVILPTREDCVAQLRARRAARSSQ
jgi:anti-anti-sigma factor